jgi:elongation factor G
LTIPAGISAALYRVSVTPKTQADAAKISPTLTRLCEEDMTLSLAERPYPETVLQGMGDQHIDVAIRAQTKFQVGPVTFEPKVPYREGITKKASRAISPQEAVWWRRSIWRSASAHRAVARRDFEFADELVGMNLSRRICRPSRRGIAPRWKKAHLPVIP